MEMLVSMVILSFLGGVIYVTFSQGLKIWNAAVKENAPWKRELFFEEFKSELRNAYVGGDPGLEGRSDSFEFYTFGRERRGAEGKIREVPVKIRYVFDSAQKAVNKEKIPYEYVLNPGPAATRESVLEGVSAWSVEYYQYPKKGKAAQASWVNRWTEPCLPEAIKITLNSEHAAQAMTTRIFPLPASGLCNDQEKL